MNSISHTEAQDLIQDSNERELSYEERAVLSAHLHQCRQCSSYQGLHTALTASGRSRRRTGRVGVSELHKRSSDIISRVGRKQRATRFTRTALYAGIGLGAFFIILVLIPPLGGLPGVINHAPGSAENPATGAGPTLAASEQSSSSMPLTPGSHPSPTATRTPLPMFEFHQLVWDEVRFFIRGEEDIVEQSQLPHHEEERVYGGSLEEAVRHSGVENPATYLIPPGFTSDQIWYSGRFRAVGACYKGSTRMGSSHWCIVQQANPFGGFIGRSGKVFPFYIDQIYAEYVSGGWLAVGPRHPADGSEQLYQWDERMVPVLRIRFELQGLNIELSGACGRGCSLFDLADSIVRGADHLP